MNPPSRHTDKINRLLRAQLDSGEAVLASGTGAEPRRSSTSIDATRADFFLVTTRRLLWSPSGKPRHRASLDFDAVTSWSDGMQYHRYALLMAHDAIERIAWAPSIGFCGSNGGIPRSPDNRPERSSISAGAIQGSPWPYATSWLAVMCDRMHRSNSTNRRARSGTRVLS